MAKVSTGKIPGKTSVKSPVKNNPTKGYKAPVAAKPKPIYASKESVQAAKEATYQRDINKYLTGDTTYTSQIAATNKALSDYLAQDQAARGQYDQQYTQNRFDLQRTSENDRKDLAEDYASRGLFRSGLFGVAEADRSNQAASQVSNLDIARNTYLGGLDAQRGNFTSQNQLTQQQARQDAISRRAIALLQGS